MKHSRHAALIAFFVVFTLMLSLVLPASARDPKPPAPAPTPAQDQAQTPEQLKQREADKKKEEEKKKWDVNNPPGPSVEAQIDTDEGTWMNLDVSPDGKEIVFDLLGDIYIMPVAGGEATALTSGVAWDMQPRFSPDGKWIAFTSDRAGGDNIWIMRRDGTDPQQVTKESFRLLNSPAWTPDGQFIVARKHFTSRRSLGAGEMWLYHRSGGDGLQLTKKPNDQKDTGEPVFSPDGRYLYYSQDVTPGPTFEYNKDPNSEIYDILRLDRQTGDVERFVTGNGGSIRPTPSPDGKRLAFVRRVRYKSALHILDLQSGEIHAIYDGLERDMQETWAIHGVYPVMAWTPDNKSLVFWAGGKIHRIDVASKQVADIPFHVKSTRKITEAVRFPVDVAPKKFPVKMLRWVEVSPKGDRVLYQALGYIWVKDMPNGTPHRLTTEKEVFEYYPSFSRDGQWVVYTTFDDAKMGTVRVASINGGENRTLTTEPGEYVEPVFSPDGTRVVYRKTSGGGITSADWGMNEGLYVVPVQGGKPVLVTKSGREPQFGAANDRVYYTASEGEGKRGFRSIELTGARERTHLVSEDAIEFQLSPDEKWIAFTERFNAWIAPFVPTGKSVDIGPDAKSIPVTKVSLDAGSYLHWSGDSTALHWSLGPELYTRELRDTFKFIEGAPKELPKPAEHGVNIAFDADYDVPSGSLALVGARIITMKGDEVIPNGVVLVEGNRITAVGSRAQVKVPAGAKVVDVSGQTILPGLVDVHWHGGQGENEFIPRQNWFNYSSLAFGVTTIHDPSNSTTEIFSASEMAKAGEVVGPRIFSTGTILYGAKAPFKAIIESLDDARGHLRRMKAVGAFSVKSYNQPRRDQRQQVIAAARELGMMVVPEGGSLYMHNMTMVADGHTGIEHSIPVAKIYKDTVQFWSKSKTFYTPTLIVGYGGNWGENYWYQKTNVWEDKRLLAFTPREVVDGRSRRRTMIPDDEMNHISNSKICKQLLDSGVSIQIGAHGQREGLGTHWEMWMLSQGGMTNMEVLRVATLNGARYLGMDKDIGSLEPGKLADLIVLEKNPLENIRNTESIRYTMVNGRIFEAMTMNEVGNHPRPRQKFFFEDDGGAGTIRMSVVNAIYDQD